MSKVASLHWMLTLDARETLLVVGIELGHLLLCLKYPAVTPGIFPKWLPHFYRMSKVKAKSLQV